MRTIILFQILFIFTSVLAQNDSSLSLKTVNQITKFVESKKEYYNSPSIAVAITDQNNTIYLKHFGNAKKRDKYLIGSNSKSFTALRTLITRTRKIKH